MLHTNDKKKKTGKATHPLTAVYVLHILRPQTAIYKKNTCSAAGVLNLLGTPGPPRSVEKMNNPRPQADKLQAIIVKPITWNAHSEPDNLRKVVVEGERHPDIQ